jgi:L-ribulokinase
MKTSGEGGPWGMALLAEYARKGKGLSLEKYLDGCFKEKPSFIEPSKEEEEGFDEYLRRYKAASILEKEAPAALK